MDETVFEAAIIGMVAGILVGIIPAILGATKDRLGLGIGGFFACAFSGLVLGLLLAVPVCAIFTWLVCKPNTT